MALSTSQDTSPLAELPPSLCGTTRSLEGGYFVPSGCTGKKFFHCTDPALLSTCIVKQMLYSLCDHRTAEFPMQQSELSNTRLQLSNLLNTDTKSINEHTAFLNTFVVITYMYRKDFKHAITTYPTSTLFCVTTPAYLLRKCF